jgi:hypothetical protein
MTFRHCIPFLLIVSMGIFAHPIRAGLVAQYTFEGSYDDVSGNGHHATHSGGTGSIITDAERGEVFNPNNSTYLDLEGIAALPHFPANSSITLTAWAKQTADPGSNYAYILQVGNNGDNPIATLGILPDGRVVSYCETSQPGGNLDQVNSYSDSAVEATDTWAGWHHLAAVYDRGTDVVTFYVDGIAAGTNSIALLDDTYGFNWPQARIGGDADGSPYFRGLIDDVRIYDEALTPAQIAEIAGADVAVINSFTATPGQFLPGDDVTLSWDVGNADSLRIDKGWGRSPPPEARWSPRPALPPGRSPRRATATA